MTIKVNTSKNGEVRQRAMTIRPDTLLVSWYEGVYLKDSVMLFWKYELTEKHEQIHGWMVPADKNDNHSCVRNVRNG